MRRVAPFALAILGLALLIGDGRARTDDSPTDQAGAGGAPPPERPVVIGTAPVAGVYYPAGGALCSRLSEERARHGLRCLVETTGGSPDNLARLREGSIDFALIQSDWQFLAVRNGLEAQGSPFKDLRAVFSLHALPVTLVAAPGSGIESLADLEGRRVNLGPPGSGVRRVGEALMGALGWSPDDFESLAELGLDVQAAALCAGEIDAFLLPASHPDPTVAAAVEGCDAGLVPIEGPAVERLIADWPFYAPARIPGGLYDGIDEPVASYGMRATLVTTAAEPERIVYELVRAVFENLPALRAEHPALAGLEAQEMVELANTAQVHEGALSYYREQGWR